MDFRFMLAATYDGQSPDGYLVAEKLDGVRAIWTGAELISRNGNAFRAPSWFVDQLPRDTLLDGELYGGRNTLGKTSGTVRKKSPVDAEWREIRFMVFDAPLAPEGFEARAKAARAALADTPVAAIVEHRPAGSRKDLAEQFQRVTRAGGEGLMLRKAGSAYEPRRTAALLKIKTVAQLLKTPEG